MDMIALANLAVSGLVQGLLIAMAAMAMSLNFGIARFPNAAVGDFMTFGAYVAIGAQLLTHASLLPAFAVSMGVTALLGWASYELVFKKLAGKPSLTCVIASIGVALVVRSAISWFFGYDQRGFDVPITRALDFGGVRVLPLDLQLAAVAIAGMALLFALLHLTPLGRRMRAIADNPLLAKASGIRSRRVMATLWLLTGAVAAAAGVCLGVKTVVSPDMGFDLLLDVFAAVILGGIGNPLGAVVGGVAIGVIQELSSPIVGASYKIAAGYAALLLMLLLRPRGLLGYHQAVR